MATVDATLVAAPSSRSRLHAAGGQAGGLKVGLAARAPGQSVGSDPGLEAAIDVEAEALEAVPCR
eukprot:3202590-Rhodomonas_salina.1